MFKLRVQVAGVEARTEVAEGGGGWGGMGGAEWRGEAGGIEQEEGGVSIVRRT